jgi:hypothetical protein
MLEYAATALDLHAGARTDLPDTIRREIARLSGEIATSIRRIELFAIQLDCLDEMRVRWMRLRAAELWAPPRPGRRAVGYGLALAAGVGANAWFRLDTDRGGYADSFWREDKLFHFAAGYLLANEAAVLGVRPGWAASLTCAAAVGFELSQRYASGRDAVASCGGAALGVIAWLRARR